MKKFKILSLLVALMLLLGFSVGCKDTNTPKDNATNQTEGFDEIVFGDDNESEDDIVVDFETGEVISSPDKDTSSDTTSSDNVSTDSASSGSTSSSEDTTSDTSSNESSKPNEDDKSNTSSTDPDRESMNGWTPWK